MFVVFRERFFFTKERLELLSCITGFESQLITSQIEDNI